MKHKNPDDPASIRHARYMERVRRSRKGHTAASMGVAPHVLLVRALRSVGLRVHTKASSVSQRADFGMSISVYGTVSLGKIRRAFRISDHYPTHARSWEGIDYSFVVGPLYTTGAAMMDAENVLREMRTL